MHFSLCLHWVCGICELMSAECTNSLKYLQSATYLPSTYNRTYEIAPCKQDHSAAHFPPPFLPFLPDFRPPFCCSSRAAPAAAAEALASAASGTCSICIDANGNHNCNSHGRYPTKHNQAGNSSSDNVACADCTKSWAQICHITITRHIQDNLPSARLHPLPQRAPEDPPSLPRTPASAQP